MIGGINNTYVGGHNINNSYVGGQTVNIHGRAHKSW